MDIKKSPLTQSQNDKELLSWMNKYLKYHGVIKEFLFTPEEVIEKGLAHCWESTELERRELSYLGHTCHELFLIKKDLSVTHTTLIYIKDKQYYWFEWAWYKHVGIHGPFNTKKETIQYVTDLFVKDNGIDIYGFIGSISIKKNFTARDYFKQATKCEELEFYYMNERDQIRKATVKDANAIKNYRDIISKESTYIANPSIDRIKENIERYITDPDKGYYIAIKNKEIIGSLTIHIDQIKSCLFIEHISVCQKAYGTGIARKLIDFAEKEAKKYSLSILELIVHKDNLRAIVFYKKVGFKEVSSIGQRIGLNNKIFQKQIKTLKRSSLENW